MASNDPTQSRFDFGNNWQSFIATVSEASISEAESGLRKLFPNDEISDATFLDIGCGSGLSMLAARRLGASQVHGVDLDPQSVAAAEQLLTGQGARIFQKSILDATPREFGNFDIVYTWGVLHHTGAMWRALERTVTFVRPGGLLAVALYRKTPLCPLWANEKRLYTKASRPAQAVIRAAYKAAFLTGLLAKGKSPAAYIRNYRSARGMSWHHDVHDWLGGYPYESARPEEIKSRLRGLGFQIERTFETPVRAGGLFGSHCDEFVAKLVGT